MNKNLPEHLKEIVSPIIDWEYIIKELHEHHYVIRPNNIQVDEIKAKKQRYEELYKETFLVAKDLYECLLRLKAQGIEYDERYLEKAERVLNISAEIKKWNYLRLGIKE